MSSRLEVYNPNPSAFLLNKSPSLLRKEQISTWKLSPTNKEISDVKKSTNVRFGLDICFLSACGNGDLEDSKLLLENGANVNTKNIDGITALHQACLDDNEDVLDFLLKNNADVNAQDSEGWTSLHAAAYCGYTNIVDRLIKSGANPATINNSGELAIDLAEKEAVSCLLRQALQERGIDAEDARESEHRKMMADICDLRERSKGCLKPADFAPTIEQTTKATPLHVAAAKGYTDVISILLECASGILESKDVDGWTPLHAATHWGQREAVRLLCEAGANLDATNLAMQTPADLADPDMTSYLRQLKEKFGVKLRRNVARSILDNAERRSLVANRRSSVNRLSMDQKMLMRMNKEKAPAAAVSHHDKAVKSGLPASPLLENVGSSTSGMDHPKSPLSPLSPLSLPKMAQICEEGDTPDMTKAHSAMASHCLGACVLPLTRTQDSDPQRGSLRSFTSIESEGPSMIVHEEENDETPAVGGEIPDVKMRGSSEELEDYVPKRRSKINSLIVKSDPSDWRSHRNAISEFDEDSDTVHRISLLMAREKSEISESQRSVTSRLALSNRRSTQGEVDLVTSKSSPLKSIEELDNVARLEAMETKFGDLEKSKMEMQKNIANLLKEQEVQRIQMERLADENKNLTKRLNDIEQSKTVEERKTQDSEIPTASYTMEELREENSKLRNENCALVRVISRLSKGRDLGDDSFKACDGCDERVGACIASLTRL